MPFSLFKMLKNRWDQVKIPASEIRFSKTFRFVAQVDAFLVIFHFWATIRLCFTTRIAWRFPEAESSLGVMEYHRFSIFENAKNFQGNRNHFGNFFDKFPGDQVPLLTFLRRAGPRPANPCCRRPLRAQSLSRGRGGRGRGGVCGLTLLSHSPPSRRTAPQLGSVN